MWLLVLKLNSNSNSNFQFQFVFVFRLVFTFLFGFADSYSYLELQFEFWVSSLESELDGVLKYSDCRFFLVSAIYPSSQLLTRALRPNNTWNMEQSTRKRESIRERERESRLWSPESKASRAHKKSLCTFSFSFRMGGRENRLLNLILDSAFDFDFGLVWFGHSIVIVNVFYISRKYVFLSFFPSKQSLRSHIKPHVIYKSSLKTKPKFKTQISKLKTRRLIHRYRLSCSSYTRESRF